MRKGTLSFSENVPLRMYLFKPLHFGRKPYPVLQSQPIGGPAICRATFVGRRHHSVNNRGLLLVQPCHVHPFERLPLPSQRVLIILAFGNQFIQGLDCPLNDKHIQQARSLLSHTVLLFAKPLARRDQTVYNICVTRLARVVLGEWREYFCR